MPLDVRDAAIRLNNMAEPIKHGGKGRGQSVKNDSGVVRLKYNHPHTNMDGEVYYTNKAATKRIRKAIRDFYK